VIAPDTPESGGAHVPETRRRVVVTGLGPVTGSGIGVEAFWDGLHQGRSPAERITRFDASPFRSRMAVHVEGFVPTEHMDRQRARRLDLFAQFAVAASRLALEDAGLDPESVDPDAAAVQMGSALGGLAHGQDQMMAFLAGGARAVDVRLATTVFCGAASCQVAIEFGFCGPNSTNAMSCASGTIAVGDAFRLIRRGEVEVALAGGVEAPLAPLSYGSFALIRAMSQRNDDPGGACRPFDAGRDGFVMGEGACVLVLEELERARARGARIYAEITGYGVTNDAHHMTAPRPDGTKAALAMRKALAMAGTEPSEVDHINAHGSSTPLNDSTESQAVRAVFGGAADGVPVTATKPFHGHALGASGAVEAAVVSLSIQRGWIPPVINLQEPGEGCDLDYVTGSGLVEEVGTVLSNSFGFGGINASLVMRRPPPSTD
jgi:3-oxoacyl-[acyl-carrier-protein] synthase II